MAPHLTDGLSALVRRPGPRLDDGLRTFLARSPVALDLAGAQHAAYRAALEAAGAALIDLPALEDLPDSVFVEDALLALEAGFILLRPRGPTRRSEPERLGASLPRDRPLLRVDRGALEGGDILRLGPRDLLVGLSGRSDAEGASALAALVEPFGYRVSTTPISTALHLKTAASMVADAVVVANPRWIDPQIFAPLEVIEVPEAEPFGANLLRVGTTLFAPAAHEQTAGRLAGAGIQATRLDISEFAKLEAGLTCMSVLIPPPRRS